MKLNVLTIKNFRSFGNKTQKVNLSKTGLTLIVGKNQDEFKSNGAGKSSLLEAIVYALYGAISNGVKNNSLVNRKTGHNMCVTLSFTKGKDKYLIKRYRKDRTNKNKAFLFCNKKNITQRSLKKTNELLQSIIGINKNTYLHSYMFGLHNGSTFAAMTDRQKKQVLDNMADLAIYPIARQVSKDDADSVKGQVDSLQSKMNATKYALKTVYGLQKSIYKSNKQHHNQLLSVKTELISKKSALLQHRHSYNWYKKQADKEQDTYEKLRSDVDKKKDKYLRQYTKVKNGYDEINLQLNGTQDKINTYKDTVDTDVSRIKDLADKKQKKCYWCGQPLNNEQRKHEIIKIAADYKSNLTSLNKARSKSKDLSKALEPLTEKLQSLEKDKPKRVDLKPYLIKYRGYLDNADNIKGSIIELKDLAKQYKTLLRNRPVKDYTKKIKKLTSAYDTEYKHLKVYQDKYKLYKGSESVYSNHGVKSMVLDLVLPILNKQTNHYLQILTGGSITVFIAPTTTSKSTGNTSEKINMEVHNSHGADDYKELSSGEKKRVDLSILLALQDYVLSKATTSMNVIAFDEVFDALDTDGIRDVIHLVEERAKHFPNILVVSHNSQLKQLFTHYLVVTKHNGNTTISKK